MLSWASQNFHGGGKYVQEGDSRSVPQFSLLFLRLNITTLKWQRSLLSACSALVNAWSPLSHLFKLEAVQNKTAINCPLDIKIVWFALILLRIWMLLFQVTETAMTLTFIFLNFHFYEKFLHIVSCSLPFLSTVSYSHFCLYLPPTFNVFLAKYFKIQYLYFP